MTANDVPDLSGLVDSTTRMVEQAELIETWTAETHQEVQTAADHGMTWDEWTDLLDALAAESASYGETGWSLPFRPWTYELDADNSADQDADHAAGDRTAEDSAGSAIRPVSNHDGPADPSAAQSRITGHERAATVSAEPSGGTALAEAETAAVARSVDHARALLGRHAAGRSATPAGWEQQTEPEPAAHRPDPHPELETDP